jgi:hypothetical protein
MFNFLFEVVLYNVKYVKISKYPWKKTEYALKVFHIKKSNFQ